MSNQGIGPQTKLALARQTLVISAYGKQKLGSAKQTLRTEQLEHSSQDYSENSVQ